MAADCSEREGYSRPRASRPTSQTSSPSAGKTSSAGRRDGSRGLGQHFWARDYYVSTVGRDEANIREYIAKQREEDRRLDQLTMFRG